MGLLRIFALLLTFNLALAVPAAVAGPPTEVVKGVIEEVIRLLSDPALKTPAQKSHRRQLIKNVIDRRFDHEEMARRCLGASWRNLNPGQQAEFVRLFGELLEASYAEKVERFSNEKVNYTSEELEGDYAEVRTMLYRKNDKIPINYRLMRKSQDWMIYDVVIEGVSLVSNYRSQFGRVISESSYGELVRRLRAKINELQTTEKL
jgi:phospholipid transport system substrate-binding protein